MKRILAISDIHGEIDMFERLLDQVGYHPDADQLILIGDYIDRGPDSKAVVDKVIALHEKGAIVLLGNHEDMMIKAFTTGEERPWRNWVERNGGDATLRSYGFTEKQFIVPADIPFETPSLTSPLLDLHMAFIQSMPRYIEMEEYIFVHAGINPDCTVKETDPHELVWIRNVFHDGYCGEKAVVFGHTPTKYLHKNQEDHSIYFGENHIIGIDGGAVFGGQLNCLEIPGRICHSVKSRFTISTE